MAALHPAIELIAMIGVVALVVGFAAAFAALRMLDGEG
jgi:xanthosine utilization system XapX-like protein